MEPDCSSNCAPLSHSFPVSGEDLPEGESFIRLKVTDSAGDTRMRSVRVDAPSAPTETIEEDPRPDSTEFTGVAGTEEASPSSPVSVESGLATSSAVYTPSTSSGMALAQSSGSTNPLILGIANESPSAIDSRFFRDPNISPEREPGVGLRVRRVRKGVPWNVAELPGYMAEFRDYRAAIAAQNRELGPSEQPIELTVVFRYGCAQDKGGPCTQDSSNAKWSPGTLPYSYKGSSAKSYVRMTGRGVVDNRGTPNESADDVRGFMDQLDAHAAEADSKGEPALPPINSCIPWNEPNDSQQPFKAKRGLGPVRAARYFRAFDQTNCLGTCVSVAGDFAQNGNGQRGDKAGPGEWVGYFDKYVAEIRRLYRGLPTTWGFHPYRDLNVLRYRPGTTGARITRRPSLRREDERFGTKLFIRKVGGRRGSRNNLWFTEVGSRIDRPANGRRVKPLENGPSGYSQAEDVRYLLTTLARTGGNRISRLYYYDLCGGNVDTFSAGLLDGPEASGCSNPRPAYRVFRDATLEQRAR